MSVLANRLRIAVVSALALLALLVTLSLLRVADGAAALVITLLLLLPLALPLPGLLRGNPRTSAWATLCVTPYLVYGLTETIANPATRPTAATILFASLLLFVLLVAQLRVARRDAAAAGGHHSRSDPSVPSGAASDNVRSGPP